jgi:hypothetical protein
MDGHGIAEDGRKAALARDLERVIDHAPEDPEASVRGVNDGRAGLAARSAGERHQRVVPDDASLVHGDRRQELLHLEHGHQVARPVEVLVHVAEVVVLVEELGDRLGIQRRPRPQLDRVLCSGGRGRRPRRGLDVVPRGLAGGAGADRDLGGQPLSVAPQVQELNAAGLGFDGGQPLRERPEAAPAAHQRPPPVVHGHLNAVVTGLEGHFDLAELLARIAVLEREGEEALDHRGELPLVLRGDPGGGGERREHRQDQRRRACVAQNGDLHPRHGMARSYPPCRSAHASPSAPTAT